MAKLHSDHDDFTLHGEQLYSKLGLIEWNLLQTKQLLQELEQSKLKTLQEIDEFLEKNNNPEDGVSNDV